MLGSLERFLGGLIEHYAGAFPTWLAPTQVVVLPIADRHREYALQVLEKLTLNEVRASLDDRSETINYRIREAQMHKTPYMLVIGDKEAAEGKVAVRHRQDGDLGMIEVDAFLDRVLAEIRGRR